MRTQLALKILIRSPARTALTLVLLSIATFALLSQAAEYAITAREVNSAAKQYYGAGSVESEPPNADIPAIAGVDFPIHLTLESTTTDQYKLLTQEQIDAVSKLPYITSADTRYMTAGISSEYERLDDGPYFFDFTSRCIVEATVLPGIVEYDYDVVTFEITDCVILAGDARDLLASDRSSSFTLEATKSNFTPPGSVGGGGMGGIQRAFYIHVGGQTYGQEQIRELAAGGRYVFVFRFETGPYPGVYIYCVGDYLSDSWCDAVWPLDGEPEDYLDLEKFAPLRELIEITNADNHTFDIVYTEDMSSIMRFADGSMALKEGRLLTRADSAGGAAVCVISMELASEHGLAVGDTITMGLGGTLFEEYVNLGAVAGTLNRYTRPVAEAELEIVGIYANTIGQNTRIRYPHFGYSVNTIFVPKPLLPVGSGALEGHIFAPGEFSFKIGDARDIPAFLDEAGPLIEGMGLTLIFDDGGWSGIEEGFRTAGRLSLIKIGVFTAAVAIATALAVYLFIGRRRNDYAVMRALGAGRREAGKALAYPLMAVAAISMLAGGAAACAYTARAVVRNNALVMLEQYAVDSAIPVGAVIGCALGQLLLTLAIALAMLRRIGRLPPLALLHGGARAATASSPDPGIRVQAPELGQCGLRRGRYVGGRAALSEGHGTLWQTRASGRGALNELPQVTDPQTRAPRPARALFALRYISRHIRRSAVKSALSAAVAALLLLAVGMLAEMKAAYSDLVAGTPIRASFTGEVQFNAIQRIGCSEYASSSYYEGLSSPVIIKHDGRELGALPLSVTNDISRYSGKDVEVTYADGYDAACMGRHGAILIISRGFADMYGLANGDAVEITPDGLFERARDMAIGLHRFNYPDDGSTDEELLDLYYEEIMESVRRQTFPYTVAGIVESPPDGYFEKIYTPGFGVLSSIFNTVDSLEVTLADPGQADEFRAFAKGKAGTGATMIMDTGKLENLRNSQRLVDMLYPMAVAAALLIGGFICCLLILQVSRESAIMRALGTTRGRTRALLVLEQAMLSAAGLLMGAGAMYAAKGAGLAASSRQLCAFGGMYAATVLVCGVICSWLATRRSALDLLQAKE